jgi:hypothetical protein
MAKKRRGPKSQSKVDDGTLPGGEASLKIRRVYPPNLVALFSDQFIISHTDNEYALSFLQTHLPLAASPDEFAQIDEIEAVCVARIIVTPAQMQRIASAVNKNLERVATRRARAKNENMNGD